MQYTKYLATVATVSLISLSTLVSAATGDAATGTATTANTGVTMTETPKTMTTSLEVEGAPRLIKKTSDSIVLEWDKVPSATAYIVKYSKTSVANSKDVTTQYDNETDSMTTTGAVITKLSTSNEKLTPATSYYFSVVAIDSTGKESDTYSDELMVTTEAATIAVSTGTTASATGVTTMAPVTLAVKDLVISDDKTFTLSFSSQLSADPVRVKITKISDSSDVAIDTVTQDPKDPSAVVVTTLSALSSASSYTLTVLSAKDTAGNNIQEGVNGLKEFTTSETLKLSAPTATPAVTAESASGTALAAVASPETATKVATGAKENVIVLAALLLSLGIVYIYRRKLI